MSIASLFCMVGYVASVGLILGLSYTVEPPRPVVIVAMLGAALIAIRCARLDAEGK